MVLAVETTCGRQNEEEEEECWIIAYVIPGIYLF